MNLSKLVLIALPAVIFAGCQTMPYQPYAREVKRKPGVGGEIALKAEHRDEDRTKAQVTMDSNCGASIAKVDEEGEVVVGQTTNSTTNQNYRSQRQSTQVGSIFGVPVTSGGSAPGNDTTGSATTTDIREWVIKYTCAQATASAAPIPKAAVSAKTKSNETAPIRRQRKAKPNVGTEAEETQGL